MLTTTGDGGKGRQLSYESPYSRRFGSRMYLRKWPRRAVIRRNWRILDTGFERETLDNLLYSHGGPTKKEGGEKERERFPAESRLPGGTSAREGGVGGLMDAFYTGTYGVAQGGYIDRGVLRKHLCLPTGIKGYNAEWQGTRDNGSRMIHVRCPRLRAPTFPLRTMHLRMAIRFSGRF